MKEWTIEEAKLLDEMKARCLNKGQYIDKKAKDKFKMLCHLEDYSVQYYEQQKEIEKLKGKLERINCLIHKAIDEREINGVGNLNLHEILELSGSDGNE